MPARALGEVGQAQQGGRSPNHEFNAKVYGRGNTTTYTYDSSDRITKYTYAEFDHEKDEENIKQFTYGYDATGKRKYKQNDMEQKTTYHKWDGDNIIRESGGNTVTYYRGANNVIGEIRGGIKRYYMYDAHGDVITITDGNHNMLNSSEYTAYGENLKNIGTEFGYNGQYYDEESGLYYLRNRYYNPELGRFMTEDPAKDGLNWYIYCNNDPVNFVDPWGLYSLRDYCENVHDLSSTTRDLIRSAIDAKMDGFLSYESMLKNLVSNGAIIREGKKMSPVVVDRRGNYIDITINATISGEMSKMSYDGRMIDSIISSGVNMYWSGTVDGVTVDTNIRYSDPRIYRTINIVVRKGSIDKSYAQGNNIVLYCTDDGYEIYPFSANNPTYAYAIEKTIAHEIGHAAFGLDHLYNKKGILL